jgi:hypothetical protein
MTDTPVLILRTEHDLPRHHDHHDHVSGVAILSVSVDYVCPPQDS